jgi:hypothetical protein
MTKLLNIKDGQLFGFIEERVTRSQFTDGGAAVGTYQLKQTLPIGASVIQALVTSVSAFLGDTSAVLTIGDGSDVDRYNTGTPSVFAAANMITTGVPSGTKEHTAAVNPTLTITSAADFTNVTAGALTVRIVYMIGG